MTTKPAVPTPSVITIAAAIIRTRRNTRFMLSQLSQYQDRHVVL